jgi:hypothetical protein
MRNNFAFFFFFFFLYEYFFLNLVDARVGTVHKETEDDFDGVVDY